jgi:Na+-transporting methylmalonyl-CoA/oxaloacetate decarboxylase gamma subunit
LARFEKTRRLASYSACAAWISTAVIVLKFAGMALVCLFLYCGVFAYYGISAALGSLAEYISAHRSGAG